VLALQKVSFPSDSSPFSVNNVVGSADVGFRIRLEGLHREHIRFSTVRVRPGLHNVVMDSRANSNLVACQYEPELFPGLIYRMLRPKCTLLIFISGKIVITGCKVRQTKYRTLMRGTSPTNCGHCRGGTGR
jgi:transcription initiation factor TFIID TATA-box-binding protein